ncbi:MAG TPA: nitroreductase family protein [Spirochaetota bacterium]|nr:nitroreductase family protein [Spirochaetota bacterium]
MEFVDVIKTRRSIRKFKQVSVPDEMMMEILEAARIAPSGSNLQPARFIVVKSEEGKEKLKQCTPLPFVHNAPATIICLADTAAFSGRDARMSELREAGAFIDTPLDGAGFTEAMKSRAVMSAADAAAYLKFNAAIAIDHMTLRAVDMGLGSCWIGMFDHKKVREAFDIDSRYLVAALIPIGFPDQNPDQRPRLPMDEILLKIV